MSNFELTEAHKWIIDHIPNKTKVLDLGCGSGNLLAHLVEDKDVTGYGIEIDYDAILDCVEKGLSVYQGDINEGLTEFSDKSFDIVILSQTLQQVKDPIEVLDEMLRIGKIGIVSFPNFGYWNVRLSILLGRTPVTKTLPFYWYNTPNIRVLTIKDFKEVCKNQGIKITKEVPLIHNPILRALSKWGFANVIAKKGLFVITRD